MELYNFDFSKKIFYHPGKVDDYKEGRRPFPVTLEVDLTNACNHRCSFFSNDSTSVSKPSLPTNQMFYDFFDWCILL